MKIDISKMKTVSIDKRIMGGQPCLGKHRITISQLLIPLSQGDSIQLVEDTYCIKKYDVTKFLYELSECFNQAIT